MGHVIGKTHEQTGSWGIEQLADGRLNFFVRTDGTSVDDVQSNVAVNAGQWNHASASYDAETGRLELYVNGKFAGASELSIDGGPMFDDSPLMIGQRKVGLGGNLAAVKGHLDDLQIYGSALTPGQVGQLFQHPGSAIDPDSFDPGKVKLLIDPATGAASIVSADGTPTQLKGYSILSTVAGLNTAGWHSLAANPNPQFDGWDEANPTGAALNELNPTGSFLVGSSTVVELGHPIAALGQLPFGTRAANLDVSFQYSTADGQSVNGVVEVVGSLAMNNLLLKVDPDTGAAVLTNDSGYTVRLGGYSILSASGSLQPADGSWSSLSDQGVGDVDEANVSAQHLSEFAAPTGSGIVLLPGQSYSMGEAFKSLAQGGEQDLKLEFVLSELLPLEGDYNSDGMVDAADYTVWRNALASSTTLPNEGATPGVVTQEDYVVWKENFGSKARLSSRLMDGVVRYQTSTASAGAAAANVPEPWGATMFLLGLCNIVCIRSRFSRCEAVRWRHRVRCRNCSSDCSN